MYDISWANLLMLMASIPAPRSKDKPDTDGGKVTKKHPVETQLEELGF
jgi:hypothetical protein